MDIIWIKRYLCISCKQATIIQRMIEHPCQGEIPDQSNCDLSTYNGQEVIGGNLLKNRPKSNWEWVSRWLSESKSKDEKPPIGGICELCLVADETIALLTKDGHINFATPEDISWRKY